MTWMWFELTTTGLTGWNTISSGHTVSEKNIHTSNNISKSFGITNG